MLLGFVCSTPVSYTHLDVYKRQILNHSSMVIDCETLVSLLQTCVLKMVVKGTAEKFAPNNFGPRPYIPASRSSDNNLINVSKDKINFIF